MPRPWNQPHWRLERRRSVSFPELEPFCRERLQALDGSNLIEFKSFRRRAILFLEDRLHQQIPRPAFRSVPDIGALCAPAKSAPALFHGTLSAKFLQLGGWLQPFLRPNER